MVEVSLCLHHHARAVSGWRLQLRRRPRRDRPPRPTRRRCSVDVAGRRCGEISAQRSPNLPPLTTTTRSPGDSVLVTAASMAPVPLHASMQHRLGGAEKIARRVGDAAEEVAELRRTVEHDGRRHGEQHLGRNRRRSRRQEITLEHWAGAENYEETRRIPLFPPGGDVKKAKTRRFAPATPGPHEIRFMNSWRVSLFWKRRAAHS